MRVAEVVERLTSVAVGFRQETESTECPGVVWNDAHQLHEPLGRSLTLAKQLTHVTQLIQNLRANSN